jgi:transcriptional regulator with XRE-family HTH domain
LRFEDRVIRDFAIRIRELRTERGLSQEKLAEEAGIHRTYLGGIELGLRNPSLRNIGRIAQALSVQVSDLFQKN